MKESFCAMLTLGLMAISFSAHAQQTAAIHDGSDVDALVQVARTYGSATYESQSNGNPAIAGRINGIPYYVSFLNCETSSTCQDVNFFAGFLNSSTTLDQINTWNRTKRFSRAYLDPEGDPIVEMDIDLRGGVTRENLDTHMSNWRLTILQFTQYIGVR